MIKNDKSNITSYMAGHIFILCHDCVIFFLMNAAALLSFIKRGINPDKAGKVQSVKLNRVEKKKKEKRAIV